MPHRSRRPASDRGDEAPPGDSEPDGRTTWCSRMRESLIFGWLRLTSRVQAGRMAIYVSVVSLIGVDAVTVIVGSAAIWPVGIPILMLALALVYLVRRRVRALRRRRDGP